MSLSVAWQCVLLYLGSEERNIQNYSVLLSPRLGANFLILNHTVPLVSKFPTYNSRELKDVQDSWMSLSQSWVISQRPHPLPFPFFKMESPLIFSSWRTSTNLPSFPVSLTPCMLPFLFLSSLWSGRCFHLTFHSLGCHLWIFFPFLFWLEKENKWP